MNLKMRLATILVSLLSALTVSIAQGQQTIAFSPDKEAKQLNSIDTAVHSDRSYNVLRKIQGQIWVLQSQVEALGASQTSTQIAEIKAGLKTLTDDLVNDLNYLDTDIQAIRDQDVKIAGGVNDTNATLQNVNTELVKIDQQQVTASKAAQNNDIETRLIAGKFELSDYTPGKSGTLDSIREFVSDKGREADLDGWRNQEYKRYLAIGDADYSNHNYHGALSNYHKAYKHLEGKVSHSFAPKSWFISTFH
jgi:hypothetical protein